MATTGRMRMVRCAKLCGCVLLCARVPCVEFDLGWGTRTDRTLAPEPHLLDRGGFWKISHQIHLHSIELGQNIRIHVDK